MLARSAFAALFGLLTIGPLFGLADGGGGPGAFLVLLPDLIAASALWLVGLVVMLLIFNPMASPYYRHEPARQEPWPRTRTRRSPGQWRAAPGAAAVGGRVFWQQRERGPSGC